MGHNSKIQWTDHTWNPWEGCTKISPGCARCYAEARNQRFTGGENWGPGKPRRRTVPHNWRLPYIWQKQYLALKAKSPETVMPPPRVFCASLADWLDDEVPIEWFRDLLQVIAENRELTWLNLTKRPEKFHLRMKAAWDARNDDTMDGAALAHNWLNGDFPEHVWFGISAEDQKRFEERGKAMEQISAVKKFISFEPLLEEIKIGTGGLVSHDPPEHDAWLKYDFDWGIVGGESGTGARPCCIDWIRKMVLEMQYFGVAPFVKQIGSRAFSFEQPNTRHFAYQNMEVPPRMQYDLRTDDQKGGFIDEWPEDLRVRDIP